MAKLERGEGFNSKRLAMPEIGHRQIGRDAMYLTVFGPNRQDSSTLFSESAAKPCPILSRHACRTTNQRIGFHHLLGFEIAER